MQVAILAGGLATRLGPMTATRPKSMLDIAGKPFLAHQLALLQRHGVDEVVLCIGHLGAEIRRHFGGGEGFGVRIRYSDEGERRLGTAGALKWAESELADIFFVLFGDSYLPLDYRDVFLEFQTRGTPAAMVVYRNQGRYDASDVEIRDGLVVRYGREPRSPDMVYINAGLSVLRRETLRTLPRERPAALQELYRPLIDAKRLAAIETRQRFYEVGSPGGLEEFRRVVTQGAPA